MTRTGRWIAVAIPVSLVASVAFFAIAVLAEARIFGTVYVLVVWSWPGQHLAALLATVAPYEVLYGSPESDFYWPAATFAGLMIWLGVFFWWAAALVGAIAWRFWKPNPALNTDAVRPQRAG